MQRTQNKIKSLKVKDTALRRRDEYEVNIAIHDCKLQIWDERWEKKNYWERWEILYVYL
jgi:hypothetical protein